MLKHIPNTITCCNLICGAIAVMYAFRADYSMAFTMIICGAVFDFFDGFAARLLHVSSPVGKELDSLADVVTFGLAPAAIVYALLREQSGEASFIPYAAFLIAAFSALRLAKFNLDTRQTDTFIGLPTPANALFWSALVLNARHWLLNTPHAEWMMIAGVLLSCWWLLAEIPMLALKFKTYGWQGNALRYSFILLSALILIWLGWTGFWLVIVAYVLLSLAANLTRAKKVA